MLRSAPRPSLLRTEFGRAPDGTPVDRWVLDNGAGIRAAVLTYGAVLHELTVPDGSGGDPRNVVLNLPTVGEYAEHSPYFGAVVGRYANRIAHGRFELDGTAYQVPVNDRGHALHGGPEGYDRRVWTAHPTDGGRSDRVALRLELHSPHLDMGFPGALDVSVVYTLDRRGTLSVDYRAATDRPTVVNLTQHTYFNLAGAGSGEVLGHRLAVDAEHYLPVDEDAIPLGPLARTAGTRFDFAGPEPRPIAAHDGDGYDHCWALTPVRDGVLRRAARLREPDSGRRLEVWTTEPGIQVYTANGLDGTLRGPDGRAYGRFGAVCLETQRFPDSPNRPEYPSAVLRPGEVFESRTEFRF
ncbi:aldose epimerase family protein [Phaeacidiphilus oryzae]|uniref:aldose epimerase family protein n=1 Tax=Phaeacidiphilus oryzae TaxID=348818 RepID=UPI0005680930|nr:aldose epimerase family protein [Phaeacidiphilus oryzae]